jgi:competence protein ComEC
MRRSAWPIVVALVGLTLLTAGCIETTGEGAERVFRQAGDQVPDAADDPFDEPPPPTAEGNLTVHVVDVGQGDGIVVHFPDHTLVYDTGRWHGDSSTAVRDHLAAEDADPDTLAISHPDADHAGGCDVVLDAFAVETIYHPGLARDTQTWEDCRQAMQAEDASVFTDADLDVGQALAWTDHGRVQLLHVDASASDPNAGSLAVEITYGNVSLALTGDMTCEAERAVLDRDLVTDVDIVQVAHHGSSTSTCERWLAATAPAVGFVSVGAHNDYGHPHDEVLDRLARAGVDTYRTDVHGALEVTTDGTDWAIATAATGEQDRYEGDDTDDEPDDPAANATGPVAIDHVRHDAEGNDNANLADEWVSLANTANETVGLANWTLSDEADHTYRFPANTTLAPEGNLTVRTGAGNDTRTDLYWDRSQAVWNNDGDRARLQDADGALVDERSW